MSFNEFELPGQPNQAASEPRLLRSNQPDADLIALQNRAARRNHLLKQEVKFQRIAAAFIATVGGASIAALYLLANTPSAVEKLAQESCQKYSPTLYKVSNPSGVPVYKSYENSTNPNNLVGYLSNNQEFEVLTLQTSRGEITVSCKQNYLGRINRTGFSPVK